MDMVRNVVNGSPQSRVITNVFQTRIGRNSYSRYAYTQKMDKVKFTNERINKEVTRNEL